MAGPLRCPRAVLAGAGTSPPRRRPTWRLYIGANEKPAATTLHPSRGGPVFAELSRWCRPRLLFDFDGTRAGIPFLNPVQPLPQLGDTFAGQPSLILGIAH